MENTDQTFTEVRRLDILVSEFFYAKKTMKTT